MLSKFVRRSLAMLSVAASALLGMSSAACSVSKPTAEKCQTVPGALTDIPTRTDQEPKMRIPVPQGWERSTKMDSENIRFAIRNQGLTADGFAPNAVVTLQKINSDLGKPQQLLDAQNEQLSRKLKVTDMKSVPAEVCGALAMSTTYTAPEVKVNPKVPTIPPRRATSLGVVYKAGDVSYVVTLTVQTVKPDDQTYVKDSETILKGFQMLPPR